MHVISFQKSDFIQGFQTSFIHFFGGVGGKNDLKYVFSFVKTRKCNLSVLAIRHSPNLTFKSTIKECIMYYVRIPGQILQIPTLSLWARILANKVTAAIPLITKRSKRIAILLIRHIQPFLLFPI